MLAEQAPLIVAGMHRSGTSFAASLLQAAGIHMGENLLGADVGNVKGHFEDLDFIRVQEGFLRKHAYDAVGWVTPAGIPVEGLEREAAIRLVNRKREENAATGRRWGWKDPRTTLFVDFWKELVPDAGWVFLYRSPWDVVDSLARRGTDPALAQDPVLAIACWLHYNVLLLKFSRKHPDRCILVCNDAVAADPIGFVDRVARFFGVSLRAPEGSLFDPSIMHAHSPGSWQASAIAAVCPEAITLFHELQKAAAMPMADNGARVSGDAASVGKALLTEWMNHEPLVKKHQNLQHHFHETQKTVSQQQRRIDELERHVENLERRLAETAHHATNLEQRLEETARHAKNLELARSELEKHTGNLEMHAKNLEMALEEAKLHAANLEKLSGWQAPTINS